MDEIIRRKTISADDLIKRNIGKPLKNRSLIIGIDGLGGSGKSFLAERISKSVNNVSIIHIDDFYLPSNLRSHIDIAKRIPGANYDLKRLRTQVIEPLLKGLDSKYQRYDWPSDSLAEEHFVLHGNLIIIEGVYALLPILIDVYDLKVWIECPKEVRLTRGLERDGISQLTQWTQEWMVQEDYYIETCKPMQKADVIINGCA